MSALREAAQQALEALEYGQHSLKQVSEYQWETRGQLAMDALRAALAQEQAEPVQEPVAWRTFDGEGGYDYRTYDDNESYAAEWAQRNPRHVGWVEPLYTSPPQRPPLTDEEITDAWCDAAIKFQGHGWSVLAKEFARAIEKKVREK